MKVRKIKKTLGFRGSHYLSLRLMGYGNSVPPAGGAAMTQIYKDRITALPVALRSHDWRNGYAHALRDAATIAAEADATVARLEAEVERLTRGRRTLTEVIHNHCLAMSAAVIEMRAGKGAQAGMAWIENTLAGPGLYPDVNEAQAMGGAQAWFDAKSEEERKRLADIDAAHKKG